MKNKNAPSDSGVRLDKWLWAARFFKTRSMAHAAIEGGKVEINGDRAKPSRLVAVGQEIRINAPRGVYTVTVTAVSDRRGPPAEAALLFQETDASKTKREEQAALRRYVGPMAPHERPNTRDRRILRRLKEDFED